MISFEKMVYYLKFSREGDIPSHTGAHGAAPGPVRRQRKWEVWARRLYCGFHGEERVRWVNRLRIG